MWTCPQCSEQVDRNFQTCWNCERARPEGIDVNEKRRIEAVSCPRCKVESEYLETKDYLETSDSPAALLKEALLHYGELFSERVRLDIYACPKCGLEFLIEHDPS